MGSSRCQKKLAFFSETAPHCHTATPFAWPQSEGHAVVVLGGLVLSGTAIRMQCRSIVSGTK